MEEHERIGLVGRVEMIGERKERGLGEERRGEEKRREEKKLELERGDDKDKAKAKAKRNGNGNDGARIESV